MGYHRAGFDEIVGVDIKPQKNYPFRFAWGDAIEYVMEYGRNYDAIHASPPCQKYTTLRGMWNHKPDHPDLVAPIREALQATGRPWVIENVPGAPLQALLMLCGTMFGLGTADGRAELRRHRYFELGFRLSTLQPHCQHGGPTVGVYGDGNGRDYRRNPVAVIGVYGGHGRDRRRKQPKTIGVYGHAGGSSAREFAQQFLTVERGQAMGIDWMTGNELSQAIPPAYTEFIGRQLLQALKNSGPLHQDGQ